MHFSWGIFPKNYNLSSISAGQSCKPIGTSQAELCYHLPRPTGYEEALTFSCRACHQVKRPLAYLLKASVFTQWIILNAGCVKNRRARSCPPVIISRGEDLRNWCGSFPHIFFLRHMWLLPCHRDGVCFLRGRPWSLLNMLIIHIKRQLPCAYQFQPQTPW